MEPIFTLWSPQKNIINKFRCLLLIHLSYSEFFSPAVPNLPYLPGLKDKAARLPLLLLLLHLFFSFFSSRPICQWVSPSHHSVWQTGYLWVVTHSSASLQPSSPAGRDSPLQHSRHTANEERPRFCSNRGHMRGIFLLIKKAASSHGH